MILAEPLLVGAVSVCLLLGLAVGAWSGWPRAGAAKAAAAATFVLALAAVTLSLARLVPGRPGLWLDAAAPMLAAYLLGCLAAAAIRALRGR